MAQIHVVHENAARAAPLFVEAQLAERIDALERRGFPCRDWHLAEGALVDRQGVAYPCDVNTSTNYNPAAEARAGISGVVARAALPGRELNALRRRAAAASVAAE